MSSCNHTGITSACVDACADIRRSCLQFSPSLQCVCVIANYENLGIPSFVTKYNGKPVLINRSGNCEFLLVSLCRSMQPTNTCVVYGVYRILLWLNLHRRIRVPHRRYFTLNLTRVLLERRHPAIVARSPSAFGKDLGDSVMTVYTLYIYTLCNRVEGTFECDVRLLCQGSVLPIRSVSVWNLSVRFFYSGIRGDNYFENDINVHRFSFIAKKGLHSLKVRPSIERLDTRSCYRSYLQQCSPT